MLLSDRVEALTGPDNATDVLVEVALHDGPGQHSIRANAAGTKVIYTRVSDGKEETCWAEEWTGDNRRATTINMLRSRGL
jgi:hypothetical protein